MTTTTVKEIKNVTDYSKYGEEGLVTEYIKVWTTTDGNESWNTGRVKSYTFTLDNVESKRYSRRGNAANAMSKKKIDKILNRNS